MVKKILYLLILVCFTYSANAQSYQNEWIDYNKTYYKFKVGPFGYDIVGAPYRRGVVRITQPTLAEAGLSNVSAEQFQLWRDGEEIRIYASKTSGILSSSDYIEFIGETANGKPDKQLYSDSSFQLSEIWNLESDSAAYFLTVNPAGNNKRYETVANNVSSATIAPEKNFMFTTGRYYRTFVNGGFGVHVEQNLYLSSYDRGEGFSSRPVHNNNSTYPYSGQRQMPQSFSSLYVDTTAPSATARFSMVGDAPYNRDIKIWLNNDSLIQFPMGYFLSDKLTVPFAVSRIKNDFANFIIQNLSNVNEDALRVATIELEYPHVFNLGGGSFLRFFIDASTQGRYLKIANFNRGTADAVLYDVTNGKRYIANTDNPDSLRFLLTPSQEKYYLFLVKGDGSTAKFINTLQQKQYTNFTQQANQGEYLIISNPLLYGSGSSNYVQQYSDYRSSDSGGHFNSKIVDIHELEDQFAYGINMHPLAIKNFLRFARMNFTEQPKYAFLIGKGIAYPSYRDPNSGHSETELKTQQLNLLPVFGSPGSDNLLSSNNYDVVPSTPIGRLSAVTPAEVGVYLEKIKQYEAAQTDTSGTIADKLWMKRVLQLAGANDPMIGYTIDSAQAKYKKIISDSSFGGDVSTFSKTADPSGYPQALFEFTDEYNKGSALLEYFGHSSSSSIDFSLDNPANYDNEGRYPVFIVNGCLAGNIFDYDVNRLNNRSTLSEKFILEPKRGAIAYLSSSSFGVLNYLDIFTEQFYKSIATRQYGKGFGNIVKDGISNALNYTGYSDFYGKMHAEQFTLHGDPALKLNSFSAPDYATDSSQIFITPDYLTVASDSLTVKVKIYNLGKAINDSVHFSVVRKFPNGNTVSVFSGNLPAINSIDSVVLRLPIIGNRDKGTTVITATIDDNNLVPELSEKNNIASANVKISADDLLPVSPYNYAIVNTNSVDLSASTAYAFDSLTQYVMELDTTALFNSSLKISRQQISTGGLITFSNIPLSLNNTVYYWRVSEDSADRHWSSFSFIYKDGGNTGFEQAHFYQYTQSSFNGMTLDSATRAFHFSQVYNNLFIQHSIYPTSGDEDNQFSVAVNGSIITWSACVGSSIIFNVFNPLTFEPVLNTSLPYNSGPICDPTRRYNFEYSTQYASTRKNAMDFLDNFVQDGYYVVARKIYDQGNADWAPTVWANDTTLYGHNNSLYHRLKEQGTQIDSFIYPRTFIFVFKKNDSAHYEPVSVLSRGLYDRISTSQNIAVNDTIGTVTSPLFGPGKAWNKVKWFGAAENNNNVTHLDVLAIDKNGKDSVWFKIDTSQHELDISSVNAAEYPYIQLRMHTQDSVTVNPYQLQDWSVEFEPVPEGAIAANLGIKIPDTLQFGHAVHVAFDTLKGYVVFKNISATSFAGLKIKLVLYDESNVAYNFSIPKTRILPAGDTVHVSFLVNATDLPEGTYNLYLEVNPDNDQPEQYHYNNFLYHYIFINREAILPVRLLDFTAKALNNNVQLQWIITNEINVANYIVEFSSTGRTFNTIGTVAATNIKALQKKYNFIHTTPVNGKNYYRIKMVDKDGRYAYSPIRVTIMGNDDVLVYPNPFRSQLNIVVSSNGAVSATVRVLDAMGKQMLQQEFATGTTLNLNHLAAGMYLVQVNDGISVRSFKVYKQ
jgi:hypothetical protein